MAFEYAAFAGFEWANGCEGTTPKTGNVYAYSDGWDYHLGYYDMALSEGAAGLYDYFTMQSFTYAEYTMITFYVKFDEMAPVPSVEFLRVFDVTGGNAHFTLNLKADGDISLEDANGTERDTYTGLAVNTWYRFHVYWKRHATAGNVRVWATANYSADSNYLTKVLEGENDDYEGGTTDPTYVIFKGQVGVSSTPCVVSIGAAAVFTGANTGENTLYLNEGIGRRQWGVPFFYVPGHAEATSDYSSDTLVNGVPDDNWENMATVPFSTSDHAGFDAEAGSTEANGLKRCDGATGRRGPYLGAWMDFQDRGEVLACGWAFQAWLGTVSAHYGKGDSTTENYSTSGTFVLRSGVQYYHSGDTHVPHPEDQESALVGIRRAPYSAAGTMAAASACVLYVPPWTKKIFTGSIVGIWKERVVLSA